MVKATDRLAEYKRKRDFARTPEPAGGKAAAAGAALQFCVQRHAARRLHYDFRLEWDGVLKSWAVPKGPSLDPGARRLAVQTEDHPLAYGDFEGTIPAGEYGAGDVLLWDRGTWTPVGDAAQGLAAGKLHFRLHGRKLGGEWLLIRLGRDGTEWLLRKIDDAAARPGEADAVLRDESSARLPVAAGRAQRSALPDFIAPQLATLAAAAPDGSGWRYEIKYDGYRMGVRVERGTVRLLSRNGNDWTARLPQLARRLQALKLPAGWLDGEIVVTDDGGHSRFQALQQALDGDPARVEFVAFDLLHLAGRDLRPLPLGERSRELAQLLPHEQGAVRRSQHLDGPGAQAWAAACRLGLEGLIAKRVDAPYRAGRSDTWLKLKCRAGQEFVIGGFTEPAGSRNGFGALLVGVRTPDGALKYAGRVGTGFDEAALRMLRQRLEGLRSNTSPFARPPKVARAHWVRPVLVAQVEFAEWTAEGLLRQASFQGLREDKDARNVGREAPSAAVGGIRVSHPERVVYTRPPLTKLDVVRYYERVGAAMLPHVAGRPLSIVRCPQGVAATCFFQKHIGVRLPPGVVRVPIAESDGGTEDYFAIERAEGIAALAQHGTIEFHTWGSRVRDVEHADRVIFDLDPDPDVAWARLVEAAVLTRDFLAELGLTGFLKTTGGKGLHVVAPLKANRDWETVKAFAQAVARRLEAVAPKRFTSNMAKAQRSGRIFIDYLRNGRGATAVAAYSLRARDGAGVSVPLPWDALTPQRELRNDAFNLLNLHERLAWSEAAWAGYDKARATLAQATLKALGVAR